MSADLPKLDEEAPGSAPDTGHPRYRAGEGAGRRQGAESGLSDMAGSSEEEETIVGGSQSAMTLPMSEREPSSMGSRAFGDMPPPSGPSSDVIRLPVVDPAMYEVVGEFARGGLGRILRARDTRLGRPVALKILIESGSEIERRFVREAIVTARLQHPGIVPIYEAGRFPDGVPFYAMRLVLGEPLSAVLRRAGNVETRIALLPHLIQASEAIAYAHSRRIIHRDIKPENILVGGFGETVVIDWGFAKNLATDTEAEDTLQRGVLDAITRVGAILGTPSYMAPEQARGKAVDERSDVYALGAILYRLLAGRRPYDEPNPAKVLRLLGEGPPPPLAARARDAPHELIAIAVKAMARKPSDRYPSARELADDLRRFQTGQLVAAHQYTPGQLVRRWIRRHSAAVIATVTALVLLSMVGVVALRGILAERDRADRERREARDAQAAAQRATITAHAAEAEALAYADELTVGQARGALKRDPTEAIAWLKRLSPGWDRWEMVRPIALSAQSQGIAEILRGHQGAVGALAFSPDGAHLASGSTDKSLRIWDLSKLSSAVLIGSTEEITALAFSPSSEQIAATSRDGLARVWTISTGVVRALAGHETTALSVAFAPDGQRLAVGGGGGMLEVWDLATGSSEVVVAHRGAVGAVAFTTDGRLLVSVGVDGVVAIYDFVSRQVRTYLREMVSLCGLALSPDGHRFAYAGEDGLLRLRDLDGDRMQRLLGHQGRVCSVGFSADGRLLVSVGADRSVRLWDSTVGSHRSFLGGDEALAAALSPDGTKVARGGADGMVRLFRAAAAGEVPPAAGLRAWLATATRAEVDASGKLTAAGP